MRGGSPPFRPPPIFLVTPLPTLTEVGANTLEVGTTVQVVEGTSQVRGYRCTPWVGKVKSVTPEGYKVQAVIGVKSIKMCAFASVSPYNAANDHLCGKRGTCGMMSENEKKRVKKAAVVELEAEAGRLREEVGALRDVNARLQASMTIEGQARLDRQARIYEKAVASLEKENADLKEEIRMQAQLFEKKEDRLNATVDSATSSASKAQNAWKEKQNA